MKNKNMTLLDAHIQFLKKNFKKGILDGANIGWLRVKSR